MAGQNDAGVDAGYSNARAYCNEILDKLRPTPDEGLRERIAQAIHSELDWLDIKQIRYAADAVIALLPTPDSNQWEDIKRQNNQYREVLITIAAQDSGIVGSTRKSDCMAALAQAALNYE